MSNTNELALTNQKLAGLLKGQQKRMESLLSSEITPTQMCALVMESFRKTPKLAECTPNSILYSVLQACVANLKIGGPFPEAHLVPYKGECILIPDWRGCIKAVTRSGYVSKVQPRSVWSEDLHFEVLYGTDDEIKHRPTLDADKGTISHVYAVFYLASGEKKFDVMSTSEVEAIRAESPAKNLKAWKDHWEQMAWKTVIKRGAKTIPIPDEDRRAIDAQEIRIPASEPADAQEVVIDHRANGAASQPDPERAELIGQLADLEASHADAYQSVMANAPCPTTEMGLKDLRDSLRMVTNEVNASKEGSAR